MIGRLISNTEEEQPIYVNSGKLSDDFSEQCHRKPVFVSSNAFVPDQDCQMKCVTTKFKRQSVNNDVFIIHHLPNNSIAEGLCPCLDWPVFWMENAFVSPLSQSSLSDIVECSLNRFQST
jgi:hypothetical protein